ncbi:hypothetical protein RHMOL_Rhmol08G0109200 [Rhododendron molle]|uniref:Uncharacterized protein n=1 Tax=Rhododendron molle TaxID=49168 RepID=A0ACC0MLX1_RHOML|nr:hypothetical protein RHMOL_Rhmol08G0109200 [Rhododendron molle]
MLKPYDKECMKMAMLKHEQTFKQQVFELHRLYRVQKSLMRSIKGSQPNRENQLDRWEFYSRSQIRLNQVNEVELEIQDEGEIQLTLGPSKYYRRKKAETPPTPESGPSFSSSSSATREEGLTGHRWGLTAANPDANSGLRIGRKSSFDVEGEDRIKQLDSWLFQPLSLNMT